MKEKILKALSEIEVEFDVRVVHAVESGSRMWGFASPDSDFDVRFFYVRPLETYLIPFKRRDTIEPRDTKLRGLVFHPDLDLTGWDLSKVMVLGAKSNPVLFEWLASQFVYIQGNKKLMDELYKILSSCLKPRSMWYHYYSSMKHNFREHLNGESVKLKKYFYILRPVLACRWIEKGLALPPPPQLPELLAVLPGDQYEGLARAVDDLLELKSRTPELGSGPRIPEIHDFITDEYNRLENRRIKPPAAQKGGGR